MKNLQLHDVERKLLDCTFEGVSLATYYKETVYFIKNRILLAYDTITGQEKHLYVISDDDEQTRNKANYYEPVTNFKILEVEEKLWFATANEFVIVDLQENFIQCFVLEFKLLTAEWNPSTTLIAVIKSNNEIAICTLDAQAGIVSILETTQLYDALPVNFVSVGWGSKETQFKGLSAKNLLTKLDICDESVYDKRPRISWRGNGQMFVVNYWNDGKRHFKVFSEMCILMHEAQSTLGLQPVIAWRPEGNSIACVVSKNNEQMITLFEKNGLSHQDFALCCNAPVEDLKWSTFSDVLAVWQKTDKGISTISLYTKSNWKWYLKQYLEFSKESPLVAFDWSYVGISSILELQTLTVKEMIKYTFKYEVNYSTMQLNEATSVCAVVDGNNVYISQFIYGTIPPPMADYVLTCSHPLNFVVFHSHDPRLALIDSENNINVYDFCNDSFHSVGQFTVKKSLCNMPLYLHHFYWKSATILCCIANSSDNKNDCIFTLHVEGDSNSWIFKTTENINKGPSFITYLHESDQTVMQMKNKILICEGKNITRKIVLPMSAVYLKSILVNNEVYVFALNPVNNFFINGVEVFNNITSFIIHDSYIMLTTMQNELLGIGVNSDSLQSVITSKLNGIYHHPLEQGYLLVCGIPNTSNIVIQHQRGNLQIISCRFISIERIEHDLREGKWDVALEKLRLERLHSNILVDLDVTRFLNSIEKFVNMNNTPALLNSFIQELIEENIFTTLYDQCGFNILQQDGNKLECVCRALINYLISVDYQHFVTTIVLASLAVKSVDSMQNALTHIGNMLNTFGNSAQAIEKAEQAMQILRNYASPLEIHQAVLSTYNLDFILFVLRNLEMDPRQYEPIMNDLKQVDEAELRFKINDMLLNNPETAVGYLIAMSKESDVHTIIDYVVKHSVYKAAFAFIDYDSVIFMELTELFSKYLCASQLHKDAGDVLKNAKLWQKALKQYIIAKAWVDALDIVQDRSADITNEGKCLEQLAYGLVSCGRVFDASRIFEVNLQDSEIAMEVLIDNKKFMAAVEMAKKYNRSDVIESDIFMAVIEYSKLLVDKLVNMKGTFYEQLNRLAEVRKKKMDKRNTNLIADLDEEHVTSFADDVMSIVSGHSTSIVSSSSHRSNKSLRSRKKTELKAIKLKQGGAYEDVALMRSLYMLIKELFELETDSNELQSLLTIYQSNIKNYISDVQLHLRNLQTDVEKHIFEIWPEELESDCDNNVWTTVLKENIEILEPQYRKAPTLKGIRINPINTAQHIARKC